MNHFDISITNRKISILGGNNMSNEPKKTDDCTTTGS